MDTEYYVYILYSYKIDKYYIGFTQNPEKRLEFHNSDLNKIWTRKGKPWKQVKVFSFENRTQARKAEIFIKKQRNRAFIERIIQKDEFVLSE